MRCSQNWKMQRWFVVLSVFFIHAVVLGEIFAFGLFVEHIMRTFPDRSREGVILVGALKFGMLIASGAGLYLVTAAAIQFEKVPEPEIMRPRWAVLVGGLSWVVGMFGAAWSPTFDGFAGTYVVMTGLGGGLVYWSTLAAIQSWFPHPRRDGRIDPDDNVFGCVYFFDLLAVAYAVIGSGSAVFGIVTSYGWSQTKDLPNTWRAAFSIIAGLGALVMLLSFFVVDERRAWERGTGAHRVANSSRSGRADDVEESEPFRPAAVGKPTFRRFAAAAAVASTWESFQFAVFLLGAACFSFAFFTPIVALPTYMRVDMNATVPEFDLDDWYIGMSMTVLSSGMLVGRIAAAVLTGAGGHWYSIWTSIFAAGAGVTVLCFRYAADFGGVEAMSFFYGFCGGGAFFLLPMMAAREWPSIFRTDENRLFVLSAVMSPGAFASALVAENIRVLNGDYFYSFVFAGVFLLGSSFFLLASHINAWWMHLPCVVLK